MVKRGDTVCPVCDSQLAKPVEFAGNALIQCPNCGDFELTGSADAEIAGSYSAPDVRARIAYTIRRLPPGSVVRTDLSRHAASTELPGANEMIDNVIIQLAASPPGSRFDLHANDVRALAGAVSTEAAAWLLKELVALKLVVSTAPVDLLASTATLFHTHLSTAGWAHHRKLMLEGAGSRRAFMAMKYGDPELDALFRGHLKPAVERTGFELSRLDEVPEAGLIDNRLRVEIRRCRFLICDLSHGNRGAYWEAGFAEGIGRPVIYLCREDVFSPGHDNHPHFDTNHQAIIKWSASDPAKAMRDLKSMIRATLPHEAKLDDGELREMKGG